MTAIRPLTTLTVSSTTLSGNITLAAGTNITLTPSGQQITITAAGGGTGDGSVTSVGTGTGLTGGPITVSGTVSLASIANNDLLANVSGISAAPVPTTLSALIDSAIGSTQGDILYRSSSGWTALPPGTSGLYLQTQGAGQNPSWQAAGTGDGSVTEIFSGTGLTGGPITTTGTLSLASINNNDLLANTSGSSAAPVDTTLTALIDAALGSTQGDILYRNSTVWTVLAPGTSGYFLKTQGSAANPVWAAAGGLSFTGANYLVNGSGSTISGFTPLAWNAGSAPTQNYDTSSFWTSAHPTRIYAPATGKYRFTCNGNIPVNTLQTTLYVMSNGGGSFSGNSLSYVNYFYYTGSGASVTSLQLDGPSWEGPLNSGDYLELYGETGASGSHSFFGNGSWFAIQQIG
jgi:hypothetical protein